MSKEIKRYAKLIMVAVDVAKGAAQSNKFYEMLYDGGSEFTVKYGRVESTSTTATYRINEWDKIYNSKIKKGYKDITDLIATKTVDNVKEVLDPGLIGKFFSKMLAYSRNLVNASYTVSTATEEQLNEAQSLINKLSTVKKADEINNLLVKLYTTIPRKMKNVKDHLNPNIDLKTFIDDEQDKLDAMRTTVAANKAPVSKEATLFSEKLGIKIIESPSTPKEIEYIIKQLKGRSIKIFNIQKQTEEDKFGKYISQYKDQSTKHLIHGTRCSNVISIVSTGLQIRPSNCASFSGKAYGEGNYFSEVAQKSLGYAGYDPDTILLVYEVFTGIPFIYDGWFKGNHFNLSYKELKKRDYNSTYVKAGKGLLNSEIIVYNESQQKLKHILWLT